jgi:hypothetical protein
MMPTLATTSGPGVVFFAVRALLTLLLIQRFADQA